MSRGRRAKFLRSDDVVELLESLPSVGLGEAYTEQERATDFLAVFSGQSTPEQGRRVLSQIAAVCDPPSFPENADKPGTLAYQDGMRRVMQVIMRMMTIRKEVVIEHQRKG